LRNKELEDIKRKFNKPEREINSIDLCQEGIPEGENR
jgi:hypothetical protein